MIFTDPSRHAVEATGGIVAVDTYQSAAALGGLAMAGGIMKGWAEQQGINLRESRSIRDAGIKGLTTKTGIGWKAASDAYDYFTSSETIKSPPVKIARGE